MAAEIKFDQVGTPGGVPGKSYTSGTFDTGAQVTITSVGGGPTTVFFHFIPLGDTTARPTLTQQTPTTWTFDPTPSVYGEWIVELVENINTAQETRVRRAFGVRLPNSGLLIPGLNEQGDFFVGLDSTTTEKAAASLISDVNEPTTVNAGIDQAGDPWDYLGWSLSQRELYLVVDTLAASSVADGNQIFIWDVDGVMPITTPNRFTTWAAVFAAANAHDGHADILIYVVAPHAPIPIPGPAGYDMNDRIGILWMGKFPIVLEFPDDTTFADPRAVVATESEIWIDDLDTISSNNQVVFQFSIDHTQNLPIGSVPDATCRFRGVRFNSHSGARYFISLFPEEVSDGTREVRAIFERCQFEANPNHLIVTSQNLTVEYRDGCVGVLPGSGAAYYRDAGVVAVTLTESFFDPPVLPPTADRVVDWDNGGATSIILNTEAHLDGYTPAIPGNWTSVPSDVGFALDELIASFAAVIPGAFDLDFVNADLTGAVLSVNHGLNDADPVPVVYDNNGLIIGPTSFQQVDADNMDIDLTGFTPLVGTWHVKMVGGTAGSGGITDLQGAYTGAGRMDIEVATPIGNLFEIRAADNTADVLLSFSRSGGIVDTIIKGPDELTAATGAAANDFDITAGAGGNSTGGGQTGGAGGELDVAGGFPGTTLSGQGGASGQFSLSTRDAGDGAAAGFGGGIAGDLNSTTGAGGVSSTLASGGSGGNQISTFGQGGDGDGATFDGGAAGQFTAIGAVGGDGLNGADAGNGTTYTWSCGPGGAGSATGRGGGGGLFNAIGNVGGVGNPPGGGSDFLTVTGVGGASLDATVQGAAGGDYSVVTSPGGLEGGPSGNFEVTTATGAASASAIFGGANAGGFNFTGGDGGLSTGTNSLGGGDGSGWIVILGDGAESTGVGLGTGGVGGRADWTMGAGANAGVGPNGPGDGGDWSVLSGIGGDGQLNGLDGGDGGDIAHDAAPGGTATGAASTAGIGGSLAHSTGDGGDGLVGAAGGSAGGYDLDLGRGGDGQGTGIGGAGADWTVTFGRGGDGSDADAGAWIIIGARGGNSALSANSGGTGTSYSFIGGVGGLGLDAISGSGGSVDQRAGIGGAATSNGAGGIGGAIINVGGTGGASAFAGELPGPGGAVTYGSGAGGAGTIAGLAGANAGQAFFVGGDGGSSIDQAGGIGGPVFLLGGLGGAGTPDGVDGAVTVGNSVSSIFMPGDNDMTLTSDGFDIIAELGTTGAFVIDSQAADTIAPFTETTTGTNGATVREFVGDRSPVGNITGNPGDIYRRSDATFSDVFLHKGAIAGTAGWVTSATHATNVIDVYSTVDFGTAVLAPDGEMRVPLVIGNIYNIHGAVVAPLWLLPEEPGGPPVITYFVSNTGNSTLLVADDSAPAIWGRNAVSLICYNITFVDVTNAGAGQGATLIDAVGAELTNTVFGLFNSFVVLFKTAGNFVDVTALVTNCVLANNESGYTLRTTGVAPSIGSVSLLGSSINNEAALPDARRPGITIIGDAGKSSFTHCNIEQGKAANSAFYIDPTIDGSLTFVAVAFESVADDGEFFRPVLATAITAQANADIVITDFADSTADPGVDTTVNFAGIVDFTRGQVILIADEAAYDGLHTIVRVASDQSSFDIAVVHSTSGAGTLKMVEHTVADNQFARDETVVLTLTTSYNGTTQVLRGTDTTFHTPQAFVANDATGTATSTSEIEASINITTAVTGVQKESQSIGSVVVEGNTVDTVITVLDDWEPLALNALAVAGSNAELWGSVNSTTGGITYLGIPDFSGEMIASLSVTSSGGNQRFQFRVVVDGTPLSDGVTPSFDLSSSPMLTVPVIAPVQCVTGQEVRIEGRNRTGTANFLVQDLSSDIS